MASKLLIIDPQNDFCDIPNAALPVSGASQDVLRTAAFLETAGADLEDLIVTLDSHPTVAIERTTFWRTGNGEEVSAFTEVTEADVRSGQYVPRNESLTVEVTAYLHALEAGGRYRLMIWPVHCVVGTWGHNIHPNLAAQIARWETSRQRGCFKVLKGMNPMTEQYSAVRAEVPRDDDPRTHNNRELIERTRPGEGWLFVAGEAASHCVAATLMHLFEQMSVAERSRVAILRDCMSAVSGFEAHAKKFFEQAAGLGARVITHGEAMQLL
ncbi:MAG: cysteine hydrolase [Povalibacter sp.]